MGKKVITTQANQITQEQARIDLERLKHLLPSLRGCSETRKMASAMLPALTQPAGPTWMMARVAALLSPYYEKDVPSGVRQIEAEDWAAALAEFPQWVIESAVRWWKSADNPNRRKRPLEGDIADQCAIILVPVRAAGIALATREPIAGPIRRDRPATAETLPLAERQARAAEIMKRAGFRCRMQGARS